MPKYIATLDFTGIQGIYYPCKRGNVYEFQESKVIEDMLKIGYLKKYDVAVTEPTLVKELKHEYETKELKVESKTKRKKKDA